MNLLIALSYCDHSLACLYAQIFREKNDRRSEMKYVRAGYWRCGGDVDKAAFWLCIPQDAFSLSREESTQETGDIISMEIEWEIKCFAGCTARQRASRSCTKEAGTQKLRGVHTL